MPETTEETTIGRLARIADRQAAEARFIDAMFSLARRTSVEETRALVETLLREEEEN